MEKVFQQIFEQHGIVPAEVGVRIQRGPSFTEYHITGNPDAVQEKIDSIMRQYHPLGYGTTAKLTETGAIVTRSNSCD